VRRADDVFLEAGFGKYEHLARERNVKRAQKTLHDLAVSAVEF